MRRRQGASLIAVGGIIWGSNGVIANFVGANPLVIVFFRVSIAVLTLLIFLGFRRRLDVLRLDASGRYLLILGAILAVTWGALFGALQSLPIGIAVLLNYMAPVIVAVCAPLILKETVTRRSVIGLSLSIAGIVLISGIIDGTFASNLWGIFLGIVAAITYAMFILLSKKMLKTVSCEAMAFYTYLVAAVILSPFPIIFGLPLFLSSYMLLAMLGIVNTATAVTLYFYGLRLIRAQDAAVLAYLEPVSALIFGFIFLGQIVSPPAFLGGVLIIIAGLIVALEKVD
ncbi:MAG: DMT family transporter [Candidatus Ranarchaeia archaeon]